LLPIPISKWKLKLALPLSPWTGAAGIAAANAVIDDVGGVADNNNNDNNNNNAAVVAAVRAETDAVRRKEEARAVYVAAQETRLGAVREVAVA
jgi:uncharacterized protein (DUF4213/DUF364 family)